VGRSSRFEQERSGFSVDAFSSVVALVAIVLAIILVRRITRDQETLMDELRPTL
jgi:hypothetical protein